ncbi:MAG: hypothetical protein ACHQWU_14465 [Gemmatimonadales bacterium]
MSRGRPLVRAACAVAISTASGGALAAQASIPVKAGITVAPDSVRIGDPFRVTVGIRAPRGATIEFPRATDSTSTVQSLDPVVVRTAADTTAVEQYADYRVAAWDVGVQRIRLDDAIVRYNGVDRRIPLSGDSVFVRSLLPADTAQRIPKPPRALFESKLFPWWLWALIAAAVVAVALLVWWWLRRRRRPAAPVVIAPFERAESEFQRIEALGLLDAGERGRYVTLMVEVLRDYLAARYAEAGALSLTSTELQHATRGMPHLPQERLTRLLTDADLIKFARRPVSTDRARELGREARAIVGHEHAASQPPVPATSKAAA